MFSMPNIAASEFKDWVHAHGACKPGADYGAGKSLSEFWATCERPDWMLWVLHHLRNDAGYPNAGDIDKLLALCAAKAIEDTTCNPNWPEACRLHGEYYSDHISETLPMTLNEDCVAAGYFGVLNALANELRANVQVMG